MFSPRLHEVWSREQPLLSPSPSPAVAAVAAVVAAVAAAVAALACLDGLVPLVLPFLVELLLLLQSFFLNKRQELSNKKCLSEELKENSQFSL